MKLLKKLKQKWMSLYTTKTSDNLLTASLMLYVCAVLMSIASTLLTGSVLTKCMTAILVLCLLAFILGAVHTSMEKHLYE